MKILKKLNLYIVLLITTIAGVVIYIVFFEPVPEDAREDSTPVFNVTTKEEKQVVNWENVSVGSDKFTDIVDDYGPILKETDLEGGKRLYDVDWKTKHNPMVVGTDSDGTVTYVEIPQSLVDKPAVYEELKRDNSLGDPNLDLYVPGSMYTKVAVYLKEGIAFEYQTYSKEILRVMRFVPVDSQEFLESWGSRFSVRVPQRWN